MNDSEEWIDLMIKQVNIGYPMNGSRFVFLVLCFFLVSGWGQDEQSREIGRSRLMGNQTFVNLAIGESMVYLGTELRLNSVEGDGARFEVGGDALLLRVARRSLPVSIRGMRIYLCDTKELVGFTTLGPYGSRKGLTKDVLICLSPADGPLLNPSKYIYPVDRADGFEWTMAENSHTYAFLSSGRQHEGTDISLSSGRLKRRDAILAMEDATVRWVKKHSGEQACICLESRADPGIYYIYQHLEASTVSAEMGDKVRRGQKMGYIWGDNRWGHLHLGVVAWGEEPVYERRYGYSIPAFAMLYELWNGDLEERTKTWTWGLWPFARNRSLVENVKRLNAFDPLLGYGWSLGDWCPAKKVEPMERGDSFSSALLKKTLFEGTVSAVTNPVDYYDFEIAAPNGRYAVNALLGDIAESTSQRIEFEGVSAGEFDLGENQFAWSGERLVQVRDGRLTIRIHLKDSSTYASLSELTFSFVDTREE